MDRVESRVWPIVWRLGLINVIFALFFLILTPVDAACCYRFVPGSAECSDTLDNSELTQGICQTEMGGTWDPVLLDCESLSRCVPGCCCLQSGANAGTFTLQDNCVSSPGNPAPAFYTYATFTPNPRDILNHQEACNVNCLGDPDPVDPPRNTYTLSGTATNCLGAGAGGGSCNGAIIYWPALDGSAYLSSVISGAWSISGIPEDSQVRLYGIINNCQYTHPSDILVDQNIVLTEPLDFNCVPTSNPCRNIQAPTLAWAPNHQPAIFVDWQIPQYCAYAAAVVQRCVGPSSSNSPDNNCDLTLMTSGNHATDGGPRFIIDNEAALASGKLLHYRVFLYSQGGGHPSASPEVTISPADPYCIKGELSEGEFCGQSPLCDVSGADCAGYTCNQNNIRQPLPPLPSAQLVCNGGQECVRRLDKTVFCADPSRCDRCNGVLGMLAFLPGFSTWSDPCMDTQQSACFLDYSHVTRDVYKSCSGGDCGIYKSPANCVDDPCQFGTGCLWNFAEGIGEFGHGACTSTSVAQTSCGDCQGASCDRITCEAIGNCYYDEGNNAGTGTLWDTEFSDVCRDASKMGCSDYDSQQDCIGVGDSSHVDVQWNLPDRSRAAAGTNEHQQISLDRMGLGSCRWVASSGTTTSAGIQYACIKDMDGYSLPLDTFDMRTADDCAMSGYDRDCVEDNVAPTTQLPVVPGGSYTLANLITLLNDGRVVNDGGQQTDTVKTYYCFQKKQGTKPGQSGMAPCYPTIEAGAELTEAIFEAIGISDEQAQEIRITFYSKDAAQNYEYPIRTVDVNVYLPAGLINIVDVEIT